MASLAINESDISLKSHQQAAVRELFSNSRYLWSQRINTFRMLASSQGSMFKTSVIENSKIANYDIGIFDQNIVANLHKLEKLDGQGKLGFQQSEAQHELSEIRINCPCHG